MNGKNSNSSTALASTECNCYTNFGVGEFYKDENNCFQGGYYLLLSYDYEKDIKHWAWRAAYFPFYIDNKGFKGACIKTLLDDDIEKLVQINKLDKLLG